MQILRQSRANMDKKDKYFMITSPEIKKVQEIKNTKQKILDFIIYEDVNSTTGEIHNVLSIKTESGVYASNSKTLIESFEKIVECFGEDFTTIAINTQRSNKGREFLVAAFVD